MNIPLSVILQPQIVQKRGKSTITNYDDSSSGGDILVSAKRCKKRKSAIIFDDEDRSNSPFDRSLDVVGGNYRSKFNHNSFQSKYCSNQFNLFNRRADQLYEGYPTPYEIDTLPPLIMTTNPQTDNLIYDAENDEINFVPTEVKSQPLQYNDDRSKQQWHYHHFSGYAVETVSNPFVFCT